MNDVLNRKRIDRNGKLIEGYRNDLTTLFLMQKIERDRCKLGGTRIDVRTGKTPKLQKIEAQIEFTQKMIEAHNAMIRILLKYPEIVR